MKKLLLLLSIAYLLFSFNKIMIDNCIINGTVEGIKDGEFIYLKESNELQEMITLDSTTIKNGKFVFTTKVEEPKLIILMYDSETTVPLIAEKGTVNITLSKTPNSTNKISGTYNNDEFQKFNEEFAVLKKDIDKRTKDFQTKNTELFQKANSEKDTITTNKILKEYKVIQNEFNETLNKYVDTHPKSFISVLIIESKFSNPDLNIEEAKKSYYTLSDELKNTKKGKKIQELINTIENKNKEKSSLNINAIAPNFTAKSPEGRSITLKKSLGKVTLIDFWASWCGPCRNENPNVVAIYKEFHSKGLNIIGVSLDQDLKRWKDAILKDKITWLQVSNLKGWEDPIAKLYWIESIPQTYLLDSSGKIVAKNLRGDELKLKIKELLESKK